MALKRFRRAFPEVNDFEDWREVESWAAGVRVYIAEHFPSHLALFEESLTAPKRAPHGPVSIAPTTPLLGPWEALKRGMGPEDVLRRREDEKAEALRRLTSGRGDEPSAHEVKSLRAACGKILRVLDALVELAEEKSMKTPMLRESKAVIQEKLKERIEKGDELYRRAKDAQPGSEEAESCEAAVSSWAKYNEQLLRQIADSDQFAREYRPGADVGAFVSVNAFETDGARALRERRELMGSIKEDLKTLQSVSERIELCELATSKASAEARSGAASKYTAHNMTVIERGDFHGPSAIAGRIDTVVQRIDDSRIPEERKEVLKALEKLIREASERLSEEDGADAVAYSEDVVTEALATKPRLPMIKAAAEELTALVKKSDSTLATLEQGGHVAERAVALGSRLAGVLQQIMEWFG